MHSSETLIGGSLGLWPWMTLLAHFDWQSAARQTTSSTHAHSPEISPSLLKNTLMFPKHGLNMNRNVTVGIKHSLKKSTIFNLQTSDPTVIDTSSDAVGQTLAASPWGQTSKLDERNSGSHADMQSTGHQTFKYLGTSGWFLTCRQNNWVTGERFHVSLDAQAYQREVSVSFSLMLHVLGWDRGQWCPCHYSREWIYAHFKPVLYIGPKFSP